LKVAERDITFDDQEEDTTPVFPDEDPSSDSMDYPVVGSSAKSGTKADRGLTLGGTVALVLVAVMVTVGGVVFFVLQKQCRTYPHPQQEPHCGDDSETFELPDPHDDFAGELDTSQGIMYRDFGKHPEATNTYPNEIFLPDLKKRPKQKIRLDETCESHYLTADRRNDQSPIPSQNIATSEQGDDYAFGSSMML
jgi:hypothetical protein